MELPPPVVKQQVRDLSVQQDIQVLRGGTASEAFGPRSAALKALREFMEAEKAVARRRIKVLYGVLGGVTLLLIIGGALAGWRLSSRTQESARLAKADLSETRKEVQALRRDVEDRWSEWETASAGMRKSLADAQAGLDTLRQQIATALDGAGDTAGAASPVLALLQEVEILRAEQVHLDQRQTYLQHEAARLDAEVQRRAEDRTALGRERDELARLVEDFAARQKQAEDRLARVNEGAGAEAAPVRSRKGASTATPATETVVSVMDELYRLRSEQLELRARQTDLLRRLEQVEEAEQLAALQQQRAHAASAQLARDVEAHLARQQDAQQRLEKLRSATAADAADLLPGLLE